MSKHTPGPWIWDGDDLRAPLTQNEIDAGWTMGEAIVITDGGYYPPFGADRHLIAAAPELLEALKNLYAMVQGECPSLLEDNHHDDLVSAAIAKAEGKS